MPRRAAALHSAGTPAPGLVPAAATSSGVTPAASPSIPAPPPRRTLRLLTPCTVSMDLPLRRCALRPLTPSVQNDLHLARDPMPEVGVRQGLDRGVASVGSEPLAVGLHGVVGADALPDRRRQRRER